MEASTSNLKFNWKDQTFPQPQSVKYFSEAEISEFLDKLGYAARPWRILLWASEPLSLWTSQSCLKYKLLFFPSAIKCRILRRRRIYFVSLPSGRPKERDSRRRTRMPECCSKTVSRKCSRQFENKTEKKLKKPILTRITRIFLFFVCNYSQRGRDALVNGGAEGRHCFTRSGRVAPRAGAHRGEG